VLRRAFLHVAEANRAKAWNELRRFLQRQVAVRHPAAGLDQALGGLGKLLKRFMSCGGGNAKRGASTDHATLELGDFGKSLLNGIFDCADLVGDIESRGFN
jgi:hypothetical protein